MDGLTMADVLSRAADLIEPEGAWTQGSLWRTSPRGRKHNDNASYLIPPEAKCFCAIGAIAFAKGVLPNQVLDEEDEVIATLGFAPFSLDEWNDDPERTQAEVVEVLREAAKRAKAAQS